MPAGRQRPETPLPLPGLPLGWRGGGGGCRAAAGDTEGMPCAPASDPPAGLRPPGSLPANESGRLVSFWREGSPRESRSG